MKPSHPQRLAAWSLAAALLLVGHCPAIAADEAINFSRDVLPILSDNCFQCHGPDANARQADLRLDTQDGALRSENPIITPGDSAGSELMRRITTDDADEVMPPADSGRKLTAEQIKRLQQWIDQGAPWGKHWAFEAPRRPEVPQVEPPEFFPLRNPLDAFVLARLNQESLSPSPEAAKETLIRRVTLDLTGLPPTVQEVDSFLADPSPEAYERVVDRLLHSPRFGERIVWDWLDAARYADTNGYQGDPTRTMHYWRDWVIAALNSNMPFDQFTMEQLAGDLLPDATPQQQIATGFHRNHMINGEGGRIAEESRVDYVQDRVETTGTVWMGLTLNCCRCHDHKFDPVAQREYYQLAAYFNSIDESGANDANGMAHPILSVASEEQKRRLEELRSAERAASEHRQAIEQQLRDQQPMWEQSLLGSSTDGNEATSELPSSIPEEVRAILRKPAGDRNHDEKKKLFEYYRDQDKGFVEARQRADSARTGREEFERSLPRTMVMRERAEPRETFILERGTYNKPGEKVTHGVPSVLPPLPADAPPNRLALARWLVAPEHPLTARVTVNRYWQTLFGTGLVKTTEDFGVQGEKPSHPELLDWLACEFVQPTVAQPSVADDRADNAWNVKHILRLIVTSSTYRQSSKLRAEVAERDPDNRLLARGPRHRLPSWMIRDQALAASGLLVERIGGPPVKGYQPPGVWEDASFGQIRYEQEHGEALYRRSLYQFWRRIVGPTVFFDVANRQTCQVKVARTNTPLQALTTLNDVTYVEAARALAERILTSGGSSPEERIDLLYRLVVSRGPTSAEQQILVETLRRLREQFGRGPEKAKKLLSIGESPRNEQLDPIEHAAYTAICNTVLNLDETLSKE